MPLSTKKSRRGQKHFLSAKKLNETDISKIPVWKITNTDRAIHRKLMKQAEKEMKKIDKKIKNGN